MYCTPMPAPRSSKKRPASADPGNTAEVTPGTKVLKAAPGSRRLTGKAKVLSSKTVYQGKVFSISQDQVEEPGGVRATRDVVRHNGSVVILAVDTGVNPPDPSRPFTAADPGILLIRQYRHAADQFLLELPAGRIDPGEKPLPAAKRELLEETGYSARKWSRHVTYFASPGFVSEAMNILLAEDLTLGEATPEEDERIELLMTPLSEVLALIHAGKIHDGKTLIGVLLYASSRHAT